jgi:hypothetical protein
MKPWTVAEMHELAQAIIEAGDSFYCRRLLDRLERGELGVIEVAAALRRTRIEATDGSHPLLMLPPNVAR